VGEYGGDAGDRGGWGAGVKDWSPEARKDRLMGMD